MWVWHRGASVQHCDPIKTLHRPCEIKTKLNSFSAVISITNPVSSLVLSLFCQLGIFTQVGGASWFCVMMVGEEKLHAAGNLIIPLCSLWIAPLPPVADPFSCCGGTMASVRLLFLKRLCGLSGHSWGGSTYYSPPQLAEKACVDHFLYGGKRTFLWRVATQVNEVINLYGSSFLPLETEMKMML